jgi:hypothetical protein
MRLTTKHRKNIVREAKKRIKIDVVNFEFLPIQQRETILYEYITKICEEKGIEFSHFTLEESKILEKIINA